MKRMNCTSSLKTSSSREPWNRLNYNSSSWMPIWFSLSLICSFRPLCEFRFVWATPRNNLECAGEPVIIRGQPSVAIKRGLAQAHDLLILCATGLTWQWTAEGTRSCCTRTSEKAAEWANYWLPEQTCWPSWPVRQRPLPSLRGLARKAL